MTIRCRKTAIILPYTPWRHYVLLCNGSNISQSLTFMTKVPHKAVLSSVPSALYMSHCISHNIVLRAVYWLIMSISAL